jgi:hypothetical protein
MPDDGLPMRVQAAAVSRKGETATIAVVVEVNGSVLGGTQPKRALRVEQGLLTVNATGKAANGTRRVFDVSLSPAQWEMLSATGLRSVWAIDLAPGRHHLRVASIDVETGRGGSVYLDVEVPRGTGLPPGLLVASHVLSAMPTIFTDPRLARWTTVTPTATRVFTRSDVLTVTVPHTGSAPVIARLSNASGEVVWEGPGTPIESLAAVQFVVPLDRAGASVYDLTVDGSDGHTRTTIGVISPTTEAGKQ